MTFASPSLKQLLYVTAGLLLLLASAGCGDASDAHMQTGAAADEPALETRLRVRTQQVRLGQLDAAGRVTGTVRAFHRATVTAEMQGRVVARSVEAGAHVDEGAVLIELEASRFELELRRSQASLQAARTVLAHAQRELERGEKLVAQSAISTQRLDDLRHAVDRARDELALAKVNLDTANRNLADTRIVAPFAGTLDSFEVNVGDFVAPGTPVATVVDLSRVRIFAGVTAGEAARITPGSSADVSFADLGGEHFEATLKSVGRVADRGDGTYGIELWLDDADERMRDGLVAEVRFEEAGKEPRLLAPRAALLRRDGRPEVFVVNSEKGRDVARPRVLRTGRSHGDWIEVLDGLEEGDAVVFDGHFALTDGSVVSVESVDAAAAPAVDAAAGLEAAAATPTSAAE